MLEAVHTMQQWKHSSDGKAAAEQRAPPRGARALIIGGLAVLLAGALYLIAVRGEALLLDLAAIAAWCF
jgi:hypothetical protein